MGKLIKGGFLTISNVKTVSNGLSMKAHKAYPTLAELLLKYSLIGFLIAIWIMAAISIVAKDTANAISPPATLGQLDYQKYQTLTLTDRAKLVVNVANGNLILQTSDMNITGTGPAFSATRFYNSESSTNGLLGANTTMSFGPDVKITANANGSATYQGPSGFTVTFPPNGSGGYSTPSEYTKAKLTSIAGGGWKLTFNQSGGSYTFNAAGQLIKEANADGLAVTYNYTGSQLTSATDTQGRTISLSNYSGSSVGKITDPTARNVQYSYTSGKLTGVTDLAGNTWSYQYFSGNQLNQITDPRGYTTLIHYDGSNRVTDITLNAYTSNAVTYNYTYNNNSAQTVIQDPLSHNTTYTYDASGRVTATQNAVGATNSSTWDISNNQTAALDPSNYSTNFTYDSNNNLTKAQNPTQANGNPGASETYAFTNAAQPYKAASKTDAQGNVVSYSYNTNGNLIQSSSTGAGNQQYKLQGDPDGSGGTINCNAKTGQACTQIDARGNSTTYTYDVNGNLLTVNYPSPRGADTYTYDSLSRVKTYTNGTGSKVTYTYDNFDRVLSATYTTGGLSLSYTYDKDGNRTQVNGGAAGQTNYTFDGFNRITKISQQQGPTSPAYKDINYTYDKVGNVITEQGDAGTVTYNYDNANQIAGVNQSVSGANYTFVFTDGRPTTVFIPGGVTQTMTYDRAGRQTSIKAVKGSTVLTDYTATYANGSGADTSMMQSEKNNVTGITTTYGYDSLNRLTSATGSGTGANSWTYAYDNNGNRTQTSKNGTYSAIAGYNAANELTTMGGAAYGGYDGTGNQTSNGVGTAFAYTPQNQTSSITPGGSATQNITYLDSGQSGRTQFGSTSYSNGLFGTYGETTSGSSRYYMHLPTGTGQTIGQQIASSTYYYLQDLHGSTVAMTDGSGNVINTYSYDPYGIKLASTGSISNAIQFQNTYLDSATNLYKMGERYYNPNEGRFSQVDPSGRDFYYNFAGLNPINFSDPKGLATGNQYASAALIGCATGAGTTAIFDEIAVAFGVTAPFGVAGAVGGCLYGAAVGIVGVDNPALANDLNFYDNFRTLYTALYE